MSAKQNPGVDGAGAVRYGGANSCTAPAITGSRDRGADMGSIIIPKTGKGQPGAMKSESLFTLTMIGAAAVGGLMAGTCFAIKETLGSKQARKCLVLGYAMWGLTAGVLGMALGVWFPVFDANSIREALLIGASFGAVCVFLFATANLGRSITFKLYGWTVEIKPYSGNSKDR